LDTIQLYFAQSTNNNHDLTTLPVYEILMNVAQIIADKRDGNELTNAQIEFLISGFAKAEIPDYQMAAFAMAVFFEGMTPAETSTLTRCMIDSGERLTWPPGRPRVDKHSTGGIGDKVSIPLTPMLACCGVDVPMISGRGLGATGGTLDKLESIPGYRCDLSIDEFRSVVNWNGCSIASASANIAPADKRFYALRDVTATVPSIPLITASILSKKVAEGIACLVLDVKWGSGAFMKTLKKARELAHSLVTVGNAMGVRTTAVITDMNQPLGRMIGNSVEIDESVDILNGKGPADVTELTLDLASRLLVAAAVSPDSESARVDLQRSIDSGAALAKLREMVHSQGGDLDAPRARAASHDVTSAETGHICRVNSERLGLAIIEMGGGRNRMDDKIDHSVGIEFLVRIGDKVEKGQTIARLFCPERLAEYAANLVIGSLGITPDPVSAPKLIVESI
jgi:pyrimidine-nucleoside phosphorylase